MSAARNDLESFGVGSIWRKRVALAAFELRRIKGVYDRRVYTTTHLHEEVNSFYDYEFEDLFAPLVVNGHSISLAGSGHRPEHIVTGKLTVEEIRSKIFTFYVDLFRWLKPREVISGLARGFDLWLAWAAIETDTKLIGAIPHPEQARGWPEDDQREWKTVRDSCTEMHVISPTYWQRDGDNAMFARDRWMVDRCTHLTSFWQGTRGGTAYTNDYAVKCGKPRLVIASI